MREDFDRKLYVFSRLSRWKYTAKFSLMFVCHEMKKGWEPLTLRLAKFLLIFVILFQIEIVSTSHNRTEALYQCCPEKYPNLALTVVFKQKAIFHHDKLLTQETDVKHGKHGHGHKHESSEENN